MVGTWFVDRWRSEGGYRELLRIAMPLVLSTASWSVQYFVDRMFLMWYSREAVSASMQAGMMSFAILALFVATASYCNTFVAQYIGARKPGMVGRAVWQAVFFSIGSGALMFMLRPVGAPMFRLLGHPADLRVMEVAYFRIILAGSVFLFVSDAVSSFFSGRGETKTIMWVNFASVGVNVFLNWLWIFGKWGFPEMGVEGAAWGTVVSYLVRAGLFFALMLRRKHRHEFGILSGCRFDRDVFFRLLRFGLPSGLSFSLEVLVWALFIALIGNLGVEEFAATTVAFQINSIAFMPMIGVGIAVSTLVGQRLGNNKPDVAAKSTWSALHLTMTYMGIVAALYWVVPQMFIAPYGANADPVTFPAVAGLTVTLLKFVAVYTLFDAATITVSGALKGAGDTRFPVVVTFMLSWTMLVMPAYIIYRIGYRSIWLTWSFATIYIVSLAVVMMLRFLWGKWRTMKVIEEVPPPHVVPYPAVPPAEFE